MKKILSGLCALSLALSFTSVFAKDNVDKEYTAEGGYFTVNSYGITIYHDKDETRYEYYPNEDTVVLYYLSSKNGEVTVPETINGTTVTYISGYSGNKKDLKKLVLPDTVTTVEDFSNYVNLESVTLSNSLTEIKYHAFRKCTSLESIEIPSSVTKIDTGAFADCSSLRRVVFNEGLLTIGAGVFMDCPIESVKLPSTLINIGKSCFLRNENLKEVIIPENVKRIEVHAFASSGLEKVEFKCHAEFMDHGAFSSDYLTEVAGLSKDDITLFWNAFAGTPWQEKMKNDDEPFLVDKKGRLVSYIGTKTDVELPDTVKTIGSMAFSSKPITSIVIPDSVTTIEETAFYQCEELRAVTIPASVTKIGQMAFSHCYRLKNITFEYSDKTLNLGSSAFQFTLASPETLVTNNRSYSNQKTAFQNTYFDEDYIPVSKNGVSYDDDYVEPTETPKATVTPEPTAATQVKPTAAPKATVKPTPAVTAAPEELTVTSKDDSILVSVSDKEVDFDDAQPFVDENGRTQIPVRAVAEALNCTVDWDAQTQTVTLSKDNVTVIIKIGSADMQAGKEIITMDTTAQIENNRTYIPLRFVGEAFGMKVNWENK